jgi:ribokinase
VLLQREIPECVNESVSVFCSSHRVPVFQDMGGADRPLSSRLLRAIALIAPNETELMRILHPGKATESEENMDEKAIVDAAHALQKRVGTPMSLLVTLGAHGALFVAGNGAVTRGASVSVPKERIVDTTGAGDTFRAAFAVSLLDGRSIAESMRFAACAAALCIQKKGALPSLPTRRDTLALFQQQQTASAPHSAL